MAASKQVKVPDLGGFEEVDVVEVHISPGDRVEKEDPLITLESDKAAMDVPSPHAGEVTSVKVKKGDKVSEGDLICEMEVEGQEGGEAKERGKEEPEEKKARGGEPEEEKEPARKEGKAAKKKEAPEREEKEQTAEREEAPEPADEGAGREGPVHASPGTRRLAREKGVDISRIEGSGRKGRITKRDVERAAERPPAEPEKKAGVALPGASVETFEEFGEVEEVALTHVQKRGARNLAASWPNVPQVTQHEDADVTELEVFRKELKKEAEKRDVKLTMLAFIMKATVSALRRYPMFNSSLAQGGESIIQKKYYHISVAVDTDQGLVVPVVRDVDRKGVFELAKELMDVSERARKGQLKLDEVRGGNFSLTNLGGIGGTAFTPVVYSPQVAVLGLSRAEMKPVWQKDQEQFEPRLVLPLSLSYDHRVIDGATAARFVVYLAEVLGDVRRVVL